MFRGAVCQGNDQSLSHGVHFEEEQVVHGVVERYPEALEGRKQWPRLQIL